jgi:hypothetical protein
MTTLNLSDDKTRADYLEGEYRYMIEAVAKLAEQYPAVLALNNLARIGRLAIRPLDTEKNAASPLVVKAALLRDGNVYPLRPRQRRVIPISTDNGAA